MNYSKTYTPTNKIYTKTNTMNISMNKTQLTKFRNDYTNFTADCYTEGLQLAVHFSEKDEVKRLGGRWNPAPEGKKGGYWWMPITRLDSYVDTICPELEPCGMTVQQWLNGRQLIVGQHGIVDQDLCNTQLRNCNTRTDTFSLTADSIGTVRFELFSGAGMVLVTHETPESSESPPLWYTVAMSQMLWDTYIELHSAKRSK